MPSTVFDNNKTQNTKNELSCTDLVGRDFEASSGKGFFDDKLDHHARSIAPAMLSRVIKNNSCAVSSSSCVDARMCGVSKYGTNRATAGNKRSPKKIKVEYPVGLDGSVFDFSKYPMPNLSRRRQTKPNRPPPKFALIQ